MSKKMLVAIAKVLGLIFTGTIISSAATYVTARAMGMTGNMPVLAVVVSVFVGQMIWIISGLLMRKSVSSIDGVEHKNKLSTYIEWTDKRIWEWVERNHKDGIEIDISDKDIMDATLNAIKKYNKEHNIVGYYELEEMINKTRS